MNPSFHEAHRCMNNKLYAARTELYPSALMILKKPENTCGIVSWGISKACTVLLCFVSWKSSLCCAVLSCWVLSDSYAMPWTAAHQAPLFMGILQARILEWVAMPSSRGSSQIMWETEPRSPTCRRILYSLSHQGSPRILEWVAYPFSRWSSWPRNSTRVSCIAGGLFYQLSYKGSPILWGVSTLAFLGSAYNLWTNNF